MRSISTSSLISIVVSRVQVRRMKRQFIDSILGGGVVTLLMFLWNTISIIEVYSRIRFSCMFLSDGDSLGVILCSMLIAPDDFLLEALCSLCSGMIRSSKFLFRVLSWTSLFLVLIRGAIGVWIGKLKVFFYRTESGAGRACDYLMGEYSLMLSSLFIAARHLKASCLIFSISCISPS